METKLSAPSPRRGHGRSPSQDERRRAARRRYTRGPLDQADDDPLSGASDPPSARSSSPAIRPRQTTLKPRSPQPSPLPRSPSRPIEDASTKDFTFLTRPENFHPLPPNTTPPAFLTPASDTPLDQLLQTGHFLAAATAAAQEILHLPLPLDLAHLFDLLHMRFACLCLVNQTSLAASESKVLGDMTSAFYRHHESNQHVVPWDLRVLAVRLQALGFGEWRRGIMQYYMLASESRSAVVAARSEGDRNEELLWIARLRDLGIRVASVLVEMGDAEAAARHLRTLDLEPDLESSDKRRIVGMEALVWLKLGELRAARRCIYRLRGNPSTPTSPSIEIPSWEHEEVRGPQENDFPTKVLSALLKTSEGDFGAAVDEWESLHDESPDDDMVVQNLAVCLLYTGRLADAREMLEKVIDEDGSAGAFRSLLFNLCTVYELCTERARDLKVGLAVKIAQAAPSEVGWDKATADFKL